MLSEKQIGESADPGGQAAAAGAGAGQNLAGVGMNTNLAPVLDVFRQAGNFDDEFGRSYSMDQNVCAECGAAFITAQQKLNIAATAKHFPGLGAATVDQNTDLGPVTLDVPRAELRSIDERPFLSAIAAGVRLVMTSWAVYPALDPRAALGTVADDRGQGAAPAAQVPRRDDRRRARGRRDSGLRYARPVRRAGCPGPGWTCCYARRATSARGRTPSPRSPTPCSITPSTPAISTVALRRVLALRDSLA